MSQLDEDTQSSETVLRAPIVWMQDVRTPLYVLEGGRGGNMDHFEILQEENSNPKIKFFSVEWANHFSILAPYNAMIAEKVMNDSGQGVFTLTDKDLESVRQ